MVISFRGMCGVVRLVGLKLVVRGMLVMMVVRCGLLWVCGVVFLKCVFSIFCVI